VGKKKNPGKPQAKIPQNNPKGLFERVGLYSSPSEEKKRKRGEKPEGVHQQKKDGG